MIDALGWDLVRVIEAAVDGGTEVLYKKCGVGHSCLANLFPEGKGG